MLADGVFFLNIMLIFNFTDNLFQYILDRDHAGHTAIFVNHDGHVITAGAKVL